MEDQCTEHVMKSEGLRQTRVIVLLLSAVCSKKKEEHNINYTGHRYCAGYFPSTCMSAFSQPPTSFFAQLYVTEANPK